MREDSRRQMAANTRFKTLTEPWIDARIEASTLKRQIAKKVGSEEKRPRDFPVT